MQTDVFAGIYSGNTSMRVVDIFDLYIMTKFVMFEKTHWKNRFKEKKLKKIIKKGEDNTLCFVFIDEEKEPHLLKDLIDLERSINLKDLNIFFDSEDINQVIKYYSNFSNVEF